VFFMSEYVLEAVSYCPPPYGAAGFGPYVLVRDDATDEQVQRLFQVLEDYDWSLVPDKSRRQGDATMIGLQAGRLDDGTRGEGHTALVQRPELVGAAGREDPHGAAVRQHERNRGGAAGA